MKRHVENHPVESTTMANSKGVGTTMGPSANKENVVDENGSGRTTSVTMVTNKIGNKRKRTVPLKRSLQQIEADTVPGNLSTSGSSTLKNSSGSGSTTLILSSSSSPSLNRTDCSGLSRSSGSYRLSKWGLSSDSSGRLSDYSGCHAQPLDLSPSPLPIRSSSSSLSAGMEDFFYKRKSARTRRVRPKRLSRLCVGRRGGYREDDDGDTSVSDRDGSSDEVARKVYSTGGLGRDVKKGVRRTKEDVERMTVGGERDGVGEMDEEDDCPRPAKVKRLNSDVRDRRNNNNNDDCYDKVAAVTKVTETVVETTMVINCCASDKNHGAVQDAVTVDTGMEDPSVTTEELPERFDESDGDGAEEPDHNQVSLRNSFIPFNPSFLVDRI